MHQVSNNDMSMQFETNGLQVLTLNHVNRERFGNKNIDCERLASNISSCLDEQNCLDEVAKSIAGAFLADATSILILNGDELIPLASYGLTPDTLGRRFKLSEHKKLLLALEMNEPLIFIGSEDDPFDGLLSKSDQLLDVHSCGAFPIKQGNEILGLVTIDSLVTGVFQTFSVNSFQTASRLVSMLLYPRLSKESSTIVNAYENVSSMRSKKENDRNCRATIIVGASKEIKTIQKEVDIVSPSSLNVLITGETGVGKELFARLIHERSKRSNNPLIYINCAALPETLAESELFGHVKGAFTGASNTRAGKFELADGGTLFLDEVGELSLAIQAKLLRVIQYGDIQRVGSDSTKIVNVRVVAATNRDLNEEVNLGHFREDLYHRLSVYPIHIPPLRERRCDISLLVGFIVERNKLGLGLSNVRVTNSALQTFQNYHWPGNIRELENVINRAMLRASADGDRKITVLSEAHLDLPPAGVFQSDVGTNGNCDLTDIGPSHGSLSERVDAFQKAIIKQTLEENSGNWSKTAELLEVDKGNIHRLGKRLGLK